MKDRWEEGHQQRKPAQVENNSSIIAYDLFNDSSEYIKCYLGIVWGERTVAGFVAM